MNINAEPVTLSREQWAWAYDTIINRGYAGIVKGLIEGKKLKLKNFDSVLQAYAFDNPASDWKVIEPVLYKHLSGGEFFKFEHIPGDINLRLKDESYVIVKQKGYGATGQLCSSMKNCCLPVIRCDAEGKEIY